ncbi:MAG: hypothetical protein WC810_22705 [Janthinobacterium sp.]|jgi:hypothetical protein
MPKLRTALSPKEEGTILATLDPNSSSFMNKTESAKKFYKCSSDRSASVLGSRALQKLDKVDSSKLKAIAGVTPEWVIERLKEHALSSKSASDRIRSLELLGKTLALFRERNITENISENKPETIDDLNSQFRALIQERESNSSDDKQEAE